MTKAKKNKGLHDSGRRQIWPSGTMTEPGYGDGRFDLIPFEPLQRLARVYQLGAEKYAPNNWKKGVPWSKCINSLERHLHSWKNGKHNEDHLAIVAWRAFALMYYERHCKNLCDIDELKRNI